MSATLHWLRPEEIEKLLHVIEECVARLEKGKGRKLDDEETTHLIKTALKTIPSSAEGTNVDPNVVLSLKLILDVVKQEKNLSDVEKKYGEDFLRHSCECISKNPEGLKLALKLILDFKKKQENNPELTTKVDMKRFCELLLKRIREPDSLSKEEKNELKELLKLVLTEMKNTAQNTAEEKTFQENFKQIVIYDGGGNIIDIEEGVFALGSKALRSLESIEESSGKDETELALEVMGIIQDESMVYPSAADKLHKGPTPPGMSE